MIRLPKRIGDHALAAESAERRLERIGRRAYFVEVRQQLAAQALAIGVVVDAGRRDDPVDERVEIAIVTHARPRGWRAWRRAACPTAGASTAPAAGPSP